MQKISVKREGFLQILSRVQPGLSTRDFVEQATCFVFSDGWCSTYNDEICCRTKTELPAEFKGAVQSKILLSVLEKMKDEDVEIWVEKGSLRLRSGDKKVSIRMQGEILLPLENVDPPEEWRPLPTEEFKSAIKQVMGAVGSEQQGFVTTCIHLTPDYIEACDGLQATRYQIQCGVSDPFLVKAKSLIPIKDLDFTKCAETSGWVHFRNKLLVYSCRRHVEKYPTEQITKLLDFSGESMSVPQGTGEASELGEVFSSEDKENNKLLVRLGNRKMVVRGDGFGGWAECPMTTNYDGESVSFRISPMLLSRLLEFGNQCEISPGKLRFCGEKWTWMTLLADAEATEISDDEEELVAVGAEAGDEEELEGEEDDSD